MKVVLRKSDSATSLLLFIYNNYLTQYNKQSLKLSSILEIMKAFGKSETATRMSLSRTVKVGILSNYTDEGEVYYSLATTGREAISKWNEEMQQFWKRYALRNNAWDKKWHILSLEFGEVQRENRTIILEKLKQIGYGVLSTNTWIAPHLQTDEIKKILTKFNMNQGAVGIHGKMTIYQDTNSFAENIFHLRELEESYHSFIEKFGEKFEETKKIYQKEWFVGEGRSLPLLHNLGWEFLNIATEDAALPKDLYPYGVGDEAAKLMIEFRRILLEASIKYLGKFD